MPDDDLTPRWLLGERRNPTVEAMLGAMGGLVAFFGILALYGELPEEEYRAAGVALALLTLLVGLLLPAVHPSRALAAAGVTLSAGAVLPLVFLVANDPETLDSRADFLVAAILAVVAWCVLFVVGPARGHGLYLGLALFGLWLGALSQTSPEELVLPFRAMSSTSVEGDRFPGGPPDDLFEPPSLEDRMQPPPGFDTIPPPSFRFQPPPTFSPRPMPTFRFPSTTTTAITQSLGTPRLVAQFDDEDDFGESRPPVAPGMVSLLFGAAYVAVGAALDRRRMGRVASAFLLVGITALLFGTMLSGPRLGGTTAGLIGLVAAVGVVVVGVTGARRFVAWLGAGAAAFALATVVSSVFDDSATAAGICLLVLGAAVVGLGVAGAERDVAEE